MKYLITQTEVYRCDTEKEAEDFLKDMKDTYSYQIISSKMEKKEQKSKGEIVDEWVRLTVKKEFNSEKDPYYAYHDNSAKISLHDDEEEYGADE